MPHDVGVQIYTMQSIAEAQAVAGLGVDHVGVTPAHLGLPGEIDHDLAAQICAALRGLATSVALSVETELPAIIEMVLTVRPDILHLCGPPGAISPDRVGELRSALPDVAIMQAIPVTGPEAIEMARAFESVVDHLILDTQDPDIPGVGAAGATHDWSVSAEIVAALDVPVVLAGGLAPDNVADAIAAVGPWGVDSLTFTNRPLLTGGFEKDLDAVGAFVTAARGMATR